jgi:DNA repair protein RecO (recombination protein O)
MSSHSAPSLLQHAWLLHRRPYSETSLLIEAFTASAGRIALIAKGARAGRKGHAAILQPFQPLLISWTQRGEVGTLTAVEPREPRVTLNGTAIFSGFYLNELLMRLLARNDPHPELFERYETTLQLLGNGALAEWPLRLFERDLLDSLGYGLLLEQSVEGQPIQPHVNYCYHLEQGPAAAGVQERCLQVSGKTLLALASGEMPDEQARREAKRLMRAALGLYLGSKPLQSRELFSQGLAAGLHPAADSDFEE